MISMVHLVNNLILIKKEAYHLLEEIKIIKRKTKIKVKMNKKIQNYHLLDVLIILMSNFQSNLKIKFEIIIMNF